MRISSDNITKLKTNEIFVFGANEAGRHGRGAAKTALNKFGAIYGQGEGLQGQSYGIPTLDGKLCKLSYLKLEYYINRFINFAQILPEFNFLVTEVGCGLAGYEVEDIARLFKSSIFVENIYLPLRFWECLKYV